MGMACVWSLSPTRTIDAVAVANNRVLHFFNFMLTYIVKILLAFELLHANLKVFFWHFEFALRILTTVENAIFYTAPY